MRGYHVFFIVLAVSLAVQVWIWKVDTLTDESIWVQRLQYFAADVRTGHFQQLHYSAHPGLPSFWAALPFQMLGMSPENSLEISVIILVSLLGAGMATVAYSILPHSWWWVTVAGITILHPLYVQSSVANAIAGPAAALGLLCLLLLEKRPTARTAAILGISFGVSLLSHFSISLLVVLPVIFFIFYRHGRRLGSMAALTTAAVFTLLNPLFLENPLEHFRFNFRYVSLHTYVLGVARLGTEDIFLISPFAALGFFVGIVTAFTGRPIVSLPRD
ncbi:MAG: hypothetical protein AAB538_02720, partial [Patescibacteria group bacterium]